jgi:UDP-N-acetylmuramoyl-tripeptide--D-alanyl-D-alanine ligase
VIAMSLSQAADALEGHRHGDDDRFFGVSTDSRTVAAGELFFALRGPHFDGHDMLFEVAQAGAAAAVVEHTVTQPPCQITVRNTRAGLGRLASIWRRQFNVPMIGVTGSAGKTTVKEMLGAIMRERGPTLVTHGNLNNDIGVPLTLFGLGSEHQAAVIEMGASRRGDIAVLSAIARPTIGLITLCAPAHLEGFGDVDTVARTKGEIVAGLDRDGVAVINNEDAFAPLWRELADSRRIISFGDGGEVSARSVVTADAQTRFRLCYAAGEIDVALACKGRHNVLNAMAAAAAALAADATLEQISHGLAAFRPLTGRLMPRAGIGGARLYDDSYGARGPWL